jgi:Arc/MetJ family transcription regulator
MGRTNVVLDEELVQKCLKATGIKTRRNLIDFALKQVLRHQNQKKIIELKGNIDWEGDLELWRENRDFA